MCMSNTQTRACLTRRCILCGYFGHNIFDLYCTSDASKMHACNWYLVVSIHGLWCNIRKFTGSQLCSTSYRVKLSECYRVPDLAETTSNLSRRYSADSYLEDFNKEPLMSGYVDEEPANVPTPQSTPNPVPALVPRELAIPPDPQSDITPVPKSSPLPGGSVSDIIDAPISESASSSGPRQSSRLPVIRVASRSMSLSCPYELHS